MLLDFMNAYTQGFCLKNTLCVVSQTDVALFAAAILAVFLLFVLIFFLSAWIKRSHVVKSPYSGLPLRRASDLPYASAEKILRFLYGLHEFDNRIISLKSAAVCRETGRVFPNCITFYGTMKVDWDFLNKRFPGNYVSWGSLTDSQQEDIRAKHESLAWFQTELSSPSPSPRAIEPEYIYTSPGPLYVDLNTKVLIGWVNVPDTIFEVLIVQQPKKQYKY